MPSYETPHKKFYDWGQGFLGLGIGCGTLLLMLGGYKKYPLARNKFILAAIWLIAWLCELAGMFWHYIYREMRFDYPIWGDSIGIPLYLASITTVCGYAVSTTFLLLLFWKIKLSKNLSLQKPQSWILWIRAMFIGAWLLLLLFSIIMSVPTGDIGTIIACFVAGTILYFLLCSERAIFKNAETCIVASHY